MSNQEIEINETEPGKEQKRQKRQERMDHTLAERANL